MIHKEALIHVYDTIASRDTTIKIQRGTFPKDNKHPDYVEIQQITGTHEDLTTFDQMVDESNPEINNFLIMSPEDAMKFYTALGIVLVGWDEQK